MIWRFARANQMIGHNFTDDVAITFALTKRKALKNFSRLYADVNESEVYNVTKQLFLYDRVSVLTDY